MKGEQLFILAIALLMTCELNAQGTKDIRVKSNCQGSILVKNEKGNVGPFTLSRGQSKTFQMPIGNDKPRVWAHTGCNSGGGCDTTEGYVSLAEMHWDARDGKTWYDISMVDGYNLPITMEPFKNTGGNCPKVRCNFNLNNCPADGKINKNGKLVACKNTNRDNPNSNYATSMRRACGTDAYSWSGDNLATKSCLAGNQGLIVTFC